MLYDHLKFEQARDATISAGILSKPLNGYKCEVVFLGQNTTLVLMLECTRTLPGNVMTFLSSCFIMLDFCIVFFMKSISI